MESKLWTMGQTEKFLNVHLKGAAEICKFDGYMSFKRVPSWTEPKHGHSFMAIDVASQGSGVRLDFLTTATQLELSLAYDAVLWEGLPKVPVQLVVEVDGKETPYPFSNIRYLGFPGFTRDGDLNFSSKTIDLGKSEANKRVTVWFPHNAITYISKIELNGEVSAFNSELPKWVHYGSSISHSGEANYPTGVWPVIAAKSLELDVVNLGLGGNAMAEPYMSEVMLDHDPEFISMKLGINSINAASHTLRTFIPAVYGLIESLVARKPDVKLLLISPIYCPPHEEGFGPTIFDMENFKATANPSPASEMVPAHLNTKRVRDALKEVVSNLQSQGVNIRYIDGLELMGEADASHLEDDLHPNSDGYALVGQRFASHPVVLSWLGR